MNRPSIQNRILSILYNLIKWPWFRASSEYSTSLINRIIYPLNPYLASLRINRFSFINSTGKYISPIGESFIEIFFRSPTAPRPVDWIVWCVYYFVSFSVFFQDIFDLESLWMSCIIEIKWMRLLKAEMCIFQLMTL